MKLKTKIFEIWKYLGIPDDTILIIPVHNSEMKQDEYIIAEKSNNRLKIETCLSNPIETLTKPFIMFQQRNKCGQFIIPEVNSIKNDKINDY